MEQDGSSSRPNAADGAPFERVNGSNGVAEGVVNGYARPSWADGGGWSGGGAVSEPGFEPLPVWQADRRGIDALTGADPHAAVPAQPTYADHRPPAAGHSAAEDSYADEPAQRSAQFAANGAFDEHAAAGSAEAAHVPGEPQPAASSSPWAPNFVPFTQDTGTDQQPPGSAQPPAEQVRPEAAGTGQRRRHTIGDSARDHMLLARLTPPGSPQSPPHQAPAVEPDSTAQPRIAAPTGRPAQAAPAGHVADVARVSGISSGMPVSGVSDSGDPVSGVPAVPTQDPGLSLGTRFGRALSDLSSQPVSPARPPGSQANPSQPTANPVGSDRVAPWQEPVTRPAVAGSVSGRGPDDDAVAEDLAHPVPDDLPQRVPGVPDVPPAVRTVVEPEPTPAGAPQLSRIASHLRRQDVPGGERPDGFDVEAVLHAVRGVAGVRGAQLRTTPNGAHHLRLDLAEGADPGAISRMVAQMLSEQMGLDAALADSPTSPVRGDHTGGVPEKVDMRGDRATGRAGVSRPSPSAATPPAPRSGMGAAAPPGQGGYAGYGDVAAEPRHGEPRRRRSASVARRPVGETRPGERAGRPGGYDGDQSAGGSPALVTGRDQGPRAVIEHVQTSTFGLDATVEVRLTVGERQAIGVASGPAVDAYVLRLAAAATAVAVDDLLRDGTTMGETGRCYIEQAAIVPMGTCEVAVVVVLLVCGGWVEQLAGSALVSGDPRRAVVRATLSAVNRRLAALIP